MHIAPGVRRGVYEVVSLLGEGGMGEVYRDHEVDHRADIFAFGVVLYEMLAGTRPFAGATPADTMSAVLTSEPPALAAGAAAGLWIGRASGRAPATDRPTAAFSFDAGFTFPPLVSLSPDGRTIAYNSPVPSSGATGVLWLRRLDGSAPPPGFPTTLGGVPLAWPRTVAGCSSTRRGSSWRWTRPRARARQCRPYPRRIVRLAPINGDGDRRSDPVILKGVSGTVVAEPDATFFVRQTTLFAQRIDMSRAALAGDPVTLATEVYESTGNGRASLGAPLGASSAGVVVFRKEQFPRQILYWVDHSGRRLNEFPKRDQFSNFDLAPAGDRISVTVRLRPFSVGSQLWLLDVVRGVATNVSTPDHTYSDSLWSPDGRHIAIGVPVDDEYQLWTIDLRDGNKTAPLVTGATALDEPKFSPDGRWVAYNASEGGRPPEIYALPFPPTGQRYRLSSQGGAQPRWRRDGREDHLVVRLDRMDRHSRPASSPGSPGWRADTGPPGNHVRLFFRGRAAFPGPAAGVIHSDARGSSTSAKGSARTTSEPP